MMNDQITEPAAPSDDDERRKLPAAVTLGRRGGMSRSERKRAASRESVAKAREVMRVIRQARADEEITEPGSAPAPDRIPNP